MLRSISSIHGFTIRATDGEIGSVDDFLFDDEQWVIRYLVANTGGWLTGRLVLVSPIAFKSVNWDGQHFEVELTRKQIEDSPSIADDQPVSRQKEEEYFQYYSYPYYWGGSGMWGMAGYPSMAFMTTGQQSKQPEGDPHLRSVRQVTGYAIQARDGDLGHVEDFIADDESWAIRYMVVDNRNWWPGRKTLVSPRWITEVSWAQSIVAVDLERETIKQGPEYDPMQLLNRQYEEQLHQHLGQSPYWE